MGDFAASIRQWVEETKGDVDKVCRMIGLELATRIIQRSPVGNPELWAANAEAALQRSEHNDIVDQINANLMSDPANVGPGGGLKRKARSQFNKRLTPAQLAKMYPFRQGQGYVGGRFRSNWFVTMNAPASGTVDQIRSEGEAIESASAAIASFKPGQTIFLCNNLPYGPRLEYEGWSSQAPAGMVRITIAEFGAIVDDAVNEVRST